MVCGARQAINVHGRRVEKSAFLYPRSEHQWNIGPWMLEPIRAVYPPDLTTRTGLPAAAL